MLKPHSSPHSLRIEPFIKNTSLSFEKMKEPIHNVRSKYIEYYISNESYNNTKDQRLNNQPFRVNLSFASRFSKVDFQISAFFGNQLKRVNGGDMCCTPIFDLALQNKKECFDTQLP